MGIEDERAVGVEHNPANFRAPEAHEALFDELPSIPAGADFTPAVAQLMAGMDLEEGFEVDVNQLPPEWSAYMRKLNPPQRAKLFDRLEIMRQRGRRELEPKE
jgi:hypothetical protein